MGWKFLGRDVRPDIRPDVHGISRPKTLCLGCYSVPELDSPMDDCFSYEGGQHQGWAGKRESRELKPSGAHSLKLGPKHLLRQNFPSKRKLGEFSLRGKIFPLRDIFPLELVFSFPQNGQFSHEMKGLRKGVFMGWGKVYDSPREGKFTSSHFLPQKMSWVVNWDTRIVEAESG